MKRKEFYMRKTETCKRKLFLLAVTLLAVFASGHAQVVTSEPTPLQENSRGVVIYFHADRGNKGLAGQPATADIYAHTGVNVETSNGKESWKYAPTWGDNNAKYKLSYVSPDLWKLDIGDLRSYYGVKADETIVQLCFVFRTGDKNLEGKGEGDSDIFLDVLGAGFQLSLTSNLDGNFVDASTGAVEFTAGSSEKGTITIAVNGKEIARKGDATSLSASYTFTSAGDYTVTATATAGGETRTATRNICYARQSTPSSLTEPPAMGATVNTDGSVTFCLAAPGKKTVTLVGSWNDWTPLNEGVMDYIDRDIAAQSDDKGGKLTDAASVRYFTLTVPAGKIKTPFSYYYSVDGKAVGDPYARLVLDQSNDPGIQSSAFRNLPEYPTGKVPDKTMIAYYDPSLFSYTWKDNGFKSVAKDDLIIYELLIRDFTGTEGKADGNGTITGAIGKIPYLKQLGVNAVELLPINEFEGNNSWGYNPNFYFAPDKAYGTPAQYKQFIDLCHRNGIAVILDIVFNQTDWQHPWLRMYGGAGESPFYNETAPHAYSVLNDWNQGHPLVLQQECDALRYWMEEFHVDGFRFDLVKGLGLNDSYANSSPEATDAYNASRVTRMRRLDKAIKEANPAGYCINEDLAGEREENEMGADGELNWANWNYAGCQFAMGYSDGSPLSGVWAPKNGRTAGTTVSYLESHDEERLAYKQDQWGVTGVKGNHKASMQRCGSAAAQLLLTPGSHMIWMFSEMGNAQSTKNSSGNDTGPKTVSWRLTDDPDNKGLLDNYIELIKIRRWYDHLFSSEAIDKGGADPYFNNSCSGWVDGRLISSVAGDEEIYCVVNPHPTVALTMTVPFKKGSNDSYHVMSRSYGSEATFDATAKSVTVAPNCYAVIGSKSLSGIDSPVQPEERLKVTADGGRIRIEGAVLPVEIWAISGIKAGSAPAGESVEIAVEPGIYVVASGPKRVKIAVSR